jgi:hypothetical protein
LPTEIVFPLSRPLSYATKGGDKAVATMLVLHAPSANHSRDCSALKEMFYEASIVQRDKIATREAPATALPAPETGAADDEDEAPRLQGSTVIIGVASAPGVSLGDFLDVGRKLLVDGLAMVDGEVKLTHHLCNQLSQADFERMVGEYVAGFICASDLQANSES